MIEQKPIPNFPGYFCTQDGRVFSARCGAKRELRPWIGSHGYLTVTLYSGTKRGKTICVHRIVAETWVSSPPPGTEVNHRNGNRLDNSASNLEWVTRAQNESHKVNVLGTGNRGSRHGMSTLVEDQVREIRRRIARGERTGFLAAEFGVHQSTISHIKSGKIWGHLLGV